MSDEHKGWTIPGEFMQQVLDQLPDGWDLTIRLESGSIRPYFFFTNDKGDDWWDKVGFSLGTYGPLDGDSVVECISGLMRLVPERGGDDE